jgi:hypothetical protein
MDGTRWRGQDGFVREILWMALVIVVIAVIVLDGIAIFSAHQTVKDEAAQAARAASTEYVQSPSPDSARLAALGELQGNNLRLTHFTVSTAPDGSPMFTVTARAHADTRLFRYLSYLGLKKWVNKVTNPSATGSWD